MKKILLIEDDQSVSRMYLRIFSPDVYEVQVAENGEEGLQKARTFLPDLILLDIMMPKTDGVRVLESLKANSITQAIPVIVLTNLAGQEEMKTRILAKGAIKYLIKSEHDPKEVVEIIKQVLFQ